MNLGCQSSCLHNVLMGSSNHQSPVLIESQQVSLNLCSLIHSRHVLRRISLPALQWLFAALNDWIQQDTAIAPKSILRRVRKPIVFTHVRPFAEIPGLPNNGVLTSLDPSFIRR